MGMQLLAAVAATDSSPARLSPSVRQAAIQHRNKLLSARAGAGAEVDEASPGQVHAKCHAVQQLLLSDTLRGKRSMQSRVLGVMTAEGVDSNALFKAFATSKTAEQELLDKGELTQIQAAAVVHEMVDIAK